MGINGLCLGLNYPLFSVGLDGDWPGWRKPDRERTSLRLGRGTRLEPYGFCFILMVGDVLFYVFRWSRSDVLHPFLI